MPATVAPLAITSSYVFYKLANSYLTIMLNTTINQFTFIATVPNNNYFSIGFGPTMTNTDMILWQANGKIKSRTSDLWSFDLTTPMNDSSQNLYSTHVVNANGSVTFTTLRNMTTPDSRRDFDFPYGQVVTLCYAALNSAAFNLHNTYGYFALKFDHPELNNPSGGISAVTL